MFVGLRKNKKMCRNSVHSLVLKTFLGPRPRGMVAAHLNGDKRDNRIENLVWCSQKENHSHKIKHGTHQFGEKHGSAKLKEVEVIEIKKLSRAKIFSYSQLAKIFKIKKPTIAAIMTNRIWRHVP